MKLGVILALTWALGGCSPAPEPTQPPAPCVVDPSVVIEWPYERLVQVHMDESTDGDVVTFEFDPRSLVDGQVTIGPANPPFVERAFGEPIVVQGQRGIEIAFRRLRMTSGERIRMDDGLIREVVEVEPGPHRRAQVVWVLGLLEETCVALVPDVERARMHVVVDLAGRHP
jgi:hypothetical protein